MPATLRINPRAAKRQPKHEVVDGVMTVGDREVCQTATAEGRREYARRTEAMATRQGFQCALCRYMMRVPTYDHQSGRGMGGANRDDRIEVEGQWHNAAVCLPCNGEKSSKRYEWQWEGEERVYVQAASR